ncbi:MAG: glutathione S-transferase family protein [Alphaproteobacteria bacterium]|nr:glutathione S-transferase family protein [Alphaproteobacteria bacterium]
MLKVLGRKNSGNVQKILWACAELGLPFERDDYGGAFGKVNEPAFRALNPNGLVPVMIEDGFALWESNTILRYLASRFGDGRLLPADARARANVERWMDWQLSALNPAIGPLFLALVRGRPEEKTPDAIKPALERTTRAFTLLDGQFAGKRFVEGEEMTVADIALGIFTYRWFALPIPRPTLPALTAWYDRLTERAGFREHVMVGLI